MTFGLFFVSFTTMEEKFINPPAYGFSMYVRSHINGYNEKPMPTILVADTFEERLDTLWYQAVNKKESKLDIAVKAIQLTEDASRYHCLKPVYDKVVNLVLLTKKCPAFLIRSLGVEKIIQNALMHK